MKNISILIITGLCCCMSIQSQTHSSSIADVVVAAEKGVIAGLLGWELDNKKDQLRQIRNLKTKETTYAKNRRVTGNLKTSPVYGAVYIMSNSLSTKIENVKSNIKTRKYATFGIMHGLKRHEADLEQQEEYYKKLKSELEVVSSGLLLSGGTGYNYTAFLKLLIRMMRVREKVHQIDKDVLSLMGVSRILAK